MEKSVNKYYWREKLNIIEKIESGTQVGMNTITIVDNEKIYYSLAVQKWDGVYKIFTRKIAENKMAAYEDYEEEAEKIIVVDKIDDVLDYLTNMLEAEVGRYFIDLWNFETPDGKVSIGKAIRNGPGQVEDFPPINVVNVKGQYVARDGNSRLYLAQKTKASSINVVIETDMNSFRDLTKRLKNNGLGNMGTPKLPTPK